MLTLTPRRRSLLPLFAGLLVIATTAFCSSEAKALSGAKAKPDKPTIQPAGPQLVLQPGKSEVLRASSPGATRFEWTLSGQGTLSSKSGDTVLYTAPDRGGAVALVNVVAYSPDAASEPSSISISIAELPAIRLEEVGIPAAWMTEEERNPKTVIQMGASPSSCHAGNKCLQARYTAGATWAGVLWWPSDCGAKGTPEAFRRARNCACAVNVLRAGNLRAIHRATFWARGEHGGEVIQFKVGSSDICPRPGRSSTLTLTAEWKEYEIDVTGLDLARVAALFMWVATDLHNPLGATFYLDDVQFEGEK